MSLELSIVIPAFNEEGNIHSLVDSLTDMINTNKWDAEIIIVNDNSSDSTGKISDEIAQNNPQVKVIHRKKGDNGMGFALMEGTKNAKGKYVIWTMADKSDRLETFPKILGKLREGNDLVLGSRYMKGGSIGELDPLKAFYSSSYTNVCRLLFGIKVHDITNAFRGFKKEVFQSMAIESGDFAISPEFAIKAHLKGYKLCEVPTSYNFRKQGIPKFKIARMCLRYAKQLLLLLKK